MYPVHMARTPDDNDDDGSAETASSPGRDAMNPALSGPAAAPLGLDEAKRLRGSGWEGDLRALRAGRPG